MSDNDEVQIIITIDNILTASRVSMEIAKYLLQNVFVSWNKPDNLIGENAIRKYLVVDFYQTLVGKQVIYFEELDDYSKNAEYHSSLQQKIKKINELGLHLQKREFHDDIIYYMNILA